MPEAAIFHHDHASRFRPTASCDGSTRVGQTVQMGWFIFRTSDDKAGLDLETLDFKKVASFTKGFRIPEQIHWAQHETLRRLDSPPSDCTLAQSALVSRSYTPLSRDAFIERSAPSSGTDSGWYIGMRNEHFDIEDIDSFLRQSLYELTIHDERMARFWLVPARAIVSSSTMTNHAWRGSCLTIWIFD
jgi:hypothetical protein